MKMLLNRTKMKPTIYMEPYRCAKTRVEWIIRVLGARRCWKI